MSHALGYAKRLIAAPSVTPATGRVFDELEAMLEPQGFAIHRFQRGEGDEGSASRGGVEGHDVLGGVVSWGSLTSNTPRRRVQSI